MKTTKTTVKDVMATQIVAVRRDATFKEMAATLRQYRISGFPVIDDEGKVIGVVSEADLLAKEALADGQPGAPGRIASVVHAGGCLVGIVSRADVLSVFDRSDDDILAEITDEVILHGFLMDPALFMVTVSDGVVTLQGTPETADLGHEVVDAIRKVQGVVAVRDQLAYPPAEHTIPPGLYF